MTTGRRSIDDILDEDDGLIPDVKEAARIVTSGDRIVQDFEEICTFVDRFGREPGTGGSPAERVLSIRLSVTRGNASSRQTLTSLDRHSLLAVDARPEPKPVTSVDDILAGDFDDILGSEADRIFDIRAELQPKSKPDYSAERHPCHDFAEFEPLFARCALELESGIRSSRRFERNLAIEIGDFFILNGITVYVAEINDPHLRNGKPDARLRCIFENGTQSDMLMRSLARVLTADTNGRRIVSLRPGPLFDRQASTLARTGTVYVLRSLSTDPAISSLSPLYKIGLTKGRVKDRISRAHEDATYLMAPVEIVAEYDFFDTDIRAAERLLHRFLAPSCLEITVTNLHGRQERPREWFMVPLRVVDEAITRLIDGSLPKVRFDATRGTITT